MNEKRLIDAGEDPVCGMPMDAAKPAATNLVLTHGGVEYSFCSDGCLSEFRDDPAWFLDQAYSPTMM